MSNSSPAGRGLVWIPRCALALALLLSVALPARLALRAQTAASDSQAEGQAASESESSDREDVDCTDPSTASMFLTASPQWGFHIEAIFCVKRAQEAEIRQALPAAMGCASEDLKIERYEQNEFVGITADCGHGSWRRGLQVTGSIDLAKMQALLRNAGATTLLIETFVAKQGVTRCHPAPAPAPSPLDDAIQCSYELDLLKGDAGSYGFAYGYAAADVWKIAVPLVFLLALPIGGTFWLRRRAWRAPEDAKAAVCFAYFRLIRWSTLGGVLIWWTATDLLHADDFAAFLAGRMLPASTGWAASLPWVLLWTGPVIVYFVCLLLSAPIHALRGAERTRIEMVGQSFWLVARFALPLLCLAFLVPAIPASPRAAVLLFVGLIVSGGFAQRRLARAQGLELYGISTGELRDRTFALAHNAGAKLQHLYVLPTEKMRLANAFAHARNNIFLTDYLLKNLSKREVDAVVAHEVAHLQKKHFAQRLGALIGGMVGFTFVTAYMEHAIPPDFPTGPLMYATVLFLIFFVSRRNEFSADAGSVKLTHDPEAMITALAKISRLNTMPIHWGKLDERTLTHPSTLKRMERIARASNMREGRLQELLAQAAAPPTDVYAIPATALPQGKVFSTRYKGRLASRMAWTVLLSMAAIPAAAAYFVQSSALTGAAMWTAYGAGFVLIIGAALALANWLPVQGVAGLERGMRGKLRAQGVADDVAGLLVALSPDASPRIYEGNWAWDIGFLSISEADLSYRGEEARFTLRREQIIRIDLGPGPVGWWRVPAVYVFWHSNDGRERAVNLWPLTKTSMRRMAADTRLLFRDLKNWHGGLPDAAEALLPRAAGVAAADALGAPAFGRVTSVEPKRAARGQGLVRDLMIDAFLAIAMAVLFRLRFDPFQANSAGGLYVIAGVWMGRFFLLWPYWAFREPNRRTTAPQRAPAPTAARQE